MTHATHEMHANSLAAYASLPLNERRREVLQCYADASIPLTDRDVAERLGWEITSARPRITDCVKAGWLYERDSVREEGSRNKVRCCSITLRGIQKLKGIDSGV